MNNPTPTKQKVFIKIAREKHIKYAPEISDMIESAAKKRGTGIAKRATDYITSKIKEGKAIIAISDIELVGFCYIETWDHSKYVANSGLIVKEKYRGFGIGKRIKKKAFRLSRSKFPHAKLFGISTNPAVLKINSDLGYRPVGFLELTQDREFWDGCKTCKNYDILLRTKMQLCLCTGMIFIPKQKSSLTSEDYTNEKQKSSVSL